MRSRKAGLAALMLLLVLLCGWAGAEERISDRRTFARRLDEATDMCPDTVELPCTQALANMVFRDEDYMTTLLGWCGIESYRYGFAASGRLKMEDIQYKAGKKIWAASRQGKTRRLSGREQSALREAQKLAAAAQGSVPEREKAIHDGLCRLVRYACDDDSFNEDDCCLGALLSGEANCDGYADAFALVMNLAGIPCRCVSGSVVSPGEDRTAETGGHAWNAVNLDGRWAMTDVTWDDMDSGDIAAHYLYYNIGSARAAWTHRFHAEALPVEIMDETDPALREGVGETEVTWGTLGEAAAGLLGQPDTLALTMPGTDVSDLEQWITPYLYAYGATDFSIVSNPGALAFVGIRYASPLTVCMNREAVLEAVEKYAQEGTEAFCLTVPGVFGTSLMAESSEGMKELLGQTRMLPPVSYAYVPNGNQFHFSDVRFYPERVTAADTEELEAALRRLAKDRPEQIMIFVQFPLGEQNLFRAAEKAGLARYSYALSGQRILLQDVTYMQSSRE